MTIDSAKILVISLDQVHQTYIKDFFDRTPFAKPDFEIARFVPADKYDFIVFDARIAPAVFKIDDFVKLPDDIQAFYFLLDRYLQDTTKYILFFGKHYYNLNQERCPSANSKFTLFARLGELINFLNNYRVD